MPSTRIIKRLCKVPLNISSVHCHRNVSLLQVRQSATKSFNCSKFTPLIANARTLGLGPTSKDFEEPAQLTGPITRAHATELVLHMNDEERKLLHTALKEYESNRIKEEFEDKLAGLRWRSKFGRPSKVPSLGDVDPTGTYCPVPEDWLKKKYASTVPKPTTKELLHLSFSNAIPFIGFGFLDNFIMIIAGDSIESSLNSYIMLSTMAAAALGNTFSDVVGIGSSYYVERAATLLGFSAPALSPIQLDMPVSRRFTNMGRVVGITIGCVLGMIPLLFKDEKIIQKKDEEKKEPKTNAVKEPIAQDKPAPAKEPNIPDKPTPAKTNISDEPKPTK